MFHKLFIIYCLAFILFEATTGAPHNSRREQSLEKSFVEFLKQDHELAGLLESANLGSGAPSRHVRQVEDELTDEQEVDAEPPTKQEGFFDRAAKFVMEVLQRFLKWINTDN